MKKIILYGITATLIAFGLFTLFLSGSIIFDLFGIRAKEGNYVLFIVWANFISSIIYLVASYGFVKNKNWTSTILGISALILINAFICFIIYIYTDGVHETKTIRAMIFRIIVTIIFVAFAYFSINKKNQININ